MYQFVSTFLGSGKGHEGQVRRLTSPEDSKAHKQKI
jgi:hypothetical protein